jgi:hypothetical protein
MKEARKIVANIVRHFVNHVVPGVIRPLHALWNEIIGFFFLAFAAWFAFAAFRSFRNLDKPNGSPFMVVVAVFAALLMLYFGVTSFLKARKISRS